MGDRFVEIPRDRLLAVLVGIGAAVKERGGEAEWGVAGTEKFLDLRLPSPSGGVVRLYTSLAEHADVARGCGEDAVRIVVGIRAPAPDGIRVTGNRRRLYRTAPAAGDRVEAFLRRLRKALRGAYAEALQIPRCWCGCGMVKRRGPKGDFWGCVAYPECKRTRRSAAKETMT